MKVVIVGGVAAGMSTATRLRRLDEQAEIVVFEMGEHVSYANCGLPYFVSDTITDREALLLQTPKSLHNRFRIDVKVHHKVTKINPSVKTVEVLNLATGKSETHEYDNLVLATGASPRKLEIKGIERALKLRDVADVDSLKLAVQQASEKTAVVLGGGFIGIEVAENLAKLGFAVTVVQRNKSVLSNFDIEMIEPLQARLEAHGVQLRLNAKVEQIDDTQVTLESGEALPAAIVVTAVGVNPDNQLAKAAGLKMGETGGLWVDGQQRTSDKNIYAAGDAVEKHGELTGEQTLIPLANLANRHGRLIADVIAGIPTAAHSSIGTVIIGAFGMAAGITGLSEQAAKNAGIPYQVIHLHPGSHAAYFPGAKRVSLKVVFNAKTGELLGAQAVGEDGVDKRIDVIATALYAGLKIDDLMNLELAYAPQFGSAKDAINQAGYVGNNVYSQTTPTLQWHELEAETAGSVLVDVRTKGEVSNGKIEGSLNIPLDELRDRVDELRGKNVIVHCAVGQRGHTATQILRANGVSVKNLDGGYITWRTAQDALNRIN